MTSDYLSQYRDLNSGPLPYQVTILFLFGGDFLYFELVTSIKQVKTKILISVIFP